ncbi:MAG: Riboflavin synthase eubacterial/eukaryotic (EC [uncultured Thiotrichaceae bacterium]|uniref:Riboflavin synthase n=1 Tax=uncultured Thiotrichaceae bacterium TaxID=298394 RepID=A0A6S6UAH5_9GAMM|nr:MAG: Riboflavin synthase eubacterial/eukaryotic (EC [uncultured Thiotrichaceae bacterium]
MFTGIIQSVGNIQAMQQRGGDMRITFNVGKLDMSDVGLGDSIAANGVCLTAIAFDESSYTADVSNETISLTSLGQLSMGSEVNLEKALTLSTRLGGHLVSGHVDGLGEVIDLYEDARSWRFRIKAPDEIAHYIADKGSICVDGVSLTVNKINGSIFELNIVPHTISETIIKHYVAGTKVNLEVDVIARYLERLLQGGAVAQTSGGITEAFLAENGYINK